MTRRQATRFQSIHFIFLALILALSACQGSPKDPVFTPTASTEAAANNNTTSTPQATQQITAEPIQPSPTPDCRLQGGTVVNEEVDSEMLGDTLYFDIYLPPCYDVDTEARYPVVYLLHGLSYRQDQWQRLGLVSTMDDLIAEGEIPPFIAVMPLESPFVSPQVSQYGNALAYDLIPWVDGQYQTLAEKDYRAIAGVSRGAAWAMHLGFDQYELFSRVGAHSLPFFEVDTVYLPGWLGLADQDLPLFFIDIGNNDGEWKTAEIIADALDENGIPHEWYLFTGDHTEEYWASHLETYLRWYAADWGEP
jgi:enterochelin esterase-like enzyme